MTYPGAPTVPPTAVPVYVRGRSILLRARVEQSPELRELVDPGVLSGELVDELARELARVIGTRHMREYIDRSGAMHAVVEVYVVAPEDVPDAIVGLTKTLVFRHG